MASPQAHVHGEVIAVHEPQASKGTSLLPRVVIASVGHPSRFPRVVPCHLDVLGRIESPQGRLLRAWPRDVLDREGSSPQTSEPSRRDVIAVATSLLLAVVAVMSLLVQVSNIPWHRQLSMAWRAFGGHTPSDARAFVEELTVHTNMAVARSACVAWPRL